MKAKKDRRVQYTMALLKDALVELMEEKHISQISVKELCERADVHRSTFYAHYHEVYDVLRQMEEELFNDLGKYLFEEEQDAFPISVDKLSRILRHLCEDEKRLKILLSENSDITLQRDIMQYIGFSSLMTDQKIDEGYREYVYLFCIHGCISVIQKWLQDGMPQPVEEISAFLYQILFEGMRSFQ